MQEPTLLQLIKQKYKQTYTSFFRTICCWLRDQWNFLSQGIVLRLVPSQQKIEDLVAWKTLWGRLIKGNFFFARECLNMKTFPYLVGGLIQYFWEGKSLQKHYHPSMGIQHSHEKGIFPVMKRSKYPYHYPKSLAPSIVHFCRPTNLRCLYQGYF